MRLPKCYMKPISICPTQVAESSCKSCNFGLIKNKNDLDASQGFPSNFPQVPENIRRTAGFP